MYWDSRITRGFHGPSDLAVPHDTPAPQPGNTEVPTRRVEMSTEERYAERPMQIVLISDDPVQTGGLAGLLANLGYPSRIIAMSTDSTETGDIANAELFVLDMHGGALERVSLLIERIRTRAGGLPPILLLSEERGEDAIARLYAAGADEVMARPLRHSVFAARLQALARRAYPRLELPSDVLHVGVYAIDIPARSLTLHGQPVKLSRREFDLALYLFRNVGKLVTRSMLENVIWGRELGVDSKTLDTHIYRLRVKLRLQPENGAQLASVYAQGFRLMLVMPSGGG